MRNPLTSCPRWSIVCILALTGLGCSSTGRSARDPEYRTIASVGDRPVGSVVGKPSSSAVADLDAPALPRDGRTRVSGRVVGLDGEPMAGARVRVADGGKGGGRVVQAVTDRAGGFSLNGLRPGSSYTLIAEYDGAEGLETGRGQVRSPESDVEIAIQADDRPLDRRRAGRAPSSRPISERFETDPVDRPGRLNAEDLPAGPEPDDLGDAGEARTVRPRSVVPVSNSGWKPKREPQAATEGPSSAVGDRSTRRASTRVEEDPEPAPEADLVGVEEEENPLPPALERAEPIPRDDGPPGRPDETSAKPKGLRRLSKSESTRPGPPPGAFTLAKDPLLPTPEPAPTTRPSGPLDAPFRLPPDDLIERMPTPKLTSVAEVEGEAPNPFAKSNPGMTWASVGAAWRSPIEREPAPLSPRRIAREASPPVSTANQRPSGPARRESAGTVESCRYDAKGRQILDLRLPDLDGRPVSLKDFDSDFILIDFWGTWCKPCLGSIPHLVALADRLGPRRLTVVGVACEDGPPSGSARHVADVADRLGINYAVLLSRRDGPSPVQESLNVQSFPTMILIDRTGRVVWRAQDAAPMTLARLDRVLDATARSAAIDRVRR